MNRENLLTELTETMIRTKRALQASMRPHMQHLDISGSQLELLITIAHLQPVSATSLAKELGLTPGAISQLVEGLVQLDLVSRQADATDRRTQQLQISANGQTHLHALRTQRASAIKTIMSELSDEELHSLLVLQHKMLAGAQASLATNKPEKG